MNSDKKYSIETTHSRGPFSGPVRLRGHFQVNGRPRRSPWSSLHEICHDKTWLAGAHKYVFGRSRRRKKLWSSHPYSYLASCTVPVRLARTRKEARTQGRKKATEKRALLALLQYVLCCTGSLMNVPSNINSSRTKFSSPNS